MVQIGELSANMTPLNINQMTRWVNTKEVWGRVNTRWSRHPDTSPHAEFGPGACGQDREPHV